MGITPLPYTYSFPGPVSCYPINIHSSLSVDKYSSTPSFITITWGGGYSSVTFNPTSTDVGVYTVRVRYEVAGDNTKYIETTFFIEVYP